MISSGCFRAFCVCLSGKKLKSENSGYGLMMFELKEGFL